MAIELLDVSEMLFYMSTSSRGTAAGQFECVGAIAMMGSAGGSLFNQRSLHNAPRPFHTAAHTECRVAASGQSALWVPFSQ